MPEQSKYVLRCVKLPDLYQMFELPLTDQGKGVFTADQPVFVTDSATAGLRFVLIVKDRRRGPRTPKQVTAPALEDGAAKAQAAEEA